MSLKRPSNWHDMDWNERREFERQAREVEDLEYDADRAKEAAEASDRRASEARRSAASAREEAQGAWEQYREAQDELDLALEFIKTKNLTTEFDDWASYRRSE